MPLQPLPDYTRASYDACQNRWGVDWPLVHYCAQNQFAAAQRVKDLIDRSHHKKFGVTVPFLALKDCADRSSGNMEQIERCLPSMIRAYSDYADKQ
jgi:hypothetical protein